MINYLLQKRYPGAQIFIPGMLLSLMRLKDPFFKNYIQGDKNFLWNVSDNDKCLAFKCTFEFLNHPNLRAPYGEDNCRGKILFLSWRRKNVEN